MITAAVQLMYMLSYNRSENFFNLRYLTNLIRANLIRAAK